MAEQPTFAYYPAFRRTAPIGDPAGAAEEIGTLFEKFPQVTVRGSYSGVGLRPDVDLLFWWIGPSVDVLQELLVELRRTRAGRNLELTHTFLGVHRPAEFTRDHKPAFLRGEEPKRYLSVYPFVRTVDWYLMPDEDRAAMLREHGMMGREFPDILPNTTSGFALGDWEWILAFEADAIERITDCLRRLRDAEARRYTKLDVPFVIGIRKELREAIEDLS